MLCYNASYGLFLPRGNGNSGAQSPLENVFTARILVFEKMTTFTYPESTTITYPLRTHEHYYRLRLWQGRLVAQCDCGDYIDAAEIERRVNDKGR